MQKIFDSGLVWFRRDLRLDDHPALRLALQQCRRVHCAFVFDRDILAALPHADRRVEFIHASLHELDETLRTLSKSEHAGLIVLHDHAVTALPALAQQLGVQAVYTAHDYEPLAQSRDARVRGALAAQGIALHTVKDHVVFEGREILSGSGTPYTVFTPYLRAWLARLHQLGTLPVHDVASLAGMLAPRPPNLRAPLPALAELGFQTTNLAQLKIPTGSRGARQLLDDFCARIGQYHETRDFPALKGPSYLGVHLRFGTLSVRRAVSLALEHDQGHAGASTWLKELVWREFYFQILANFPHVVTSAFKPAYDAIRWEHGPHAHTLFQAWCEGRTGYPIVDAAMMQLRQSGYMHNRLRMVAGSFLVKDLGIDWRWGERHFAEQLNDFDLAANNGGWQWVASTGCDAQPWFRIFNPVSQSRKFDPQGRFIRRYLPQLAALPDTALHAPWLASPLELEAAGVRLGQNYPLPLVRHDEARMHTLKRYAVVRQTGKQED